MVLLPLVTSTLLDEQMKLVMAGGAVSWLLEI